MIKYIIEDTAVTFEEIPNEISLCFNISNCQHHCKGCHSPYLRNDIGAELTEEAIDAEICKNNGITCVCFMGEGNDKERIYELSKHIKESYPKIKTALYTGGKSFWNKFTEVFDYIKYGPYIEEYGPLTSKTTNQRLIEFNHDKGLCCQWHMRDITNKFWKRYERNN